MVKLLLVYISVFAFALYGCGVRQSGKELYLKYSKKEVPKCFENFQGMGKEAFPDFMSWGVFKYNASYNCIQKEYLDDTVVQEKKYLEDSSIVIQDQGFTISEWKYFRNDLSFYKEATEANFIQSSYESDNKIYFTGIKYPYVHKILYDTVTTNVIHLVTTIRE